MSAIVHNAAISDQKTNSIRKIWRPFYLHLPLRLRPTLPHPDSVPHLKYVASTNISAENAALWSGFFSVSDLNKLCGYLFFASWRILSVS